MGKSSTPTGWDILILSGLGFYLVLRPLASGMDPVEVETGLLALVQAVTLVVWAIYRLHKPDTVFLPKSIWISGLCFAVAISVAVGQAYRLTNGQTALTQSIPYWSDLAMLLPIFDLACRPISRRYLIAVIVAAAAASLTYAFYHTAFGLSYFRDFLLRNNQLPSQSTDITALTTAFITRVTSNRAIGSFGYANALAAFALLFMPVGLALLIRQNIHEKLFVPKAKFWQVFTTDFATICITLFTLITFVCFLLTQSRAGLLTAKLVEILTLTWFYWKTAAKSLSSSVAADSVSPTLSYKLKAIIAGNVLADISVGTVLAAIPAALFYIVSVSLLKDDSLQQCINIITTFIFSTAWIMELLLFYNWSQRGVHGLPGKARVFIWSGLILGVFALIILCLIPQESVPGFLAPVRHGLVTLFLVRGGYYLGAIAVFFDHILLGSGLDNFGNIYPEYRLVWAWVTNRVHNHYLQLASDGGLILIGSFLTLLVLVLRFTATQLKIAPDNSEKTDYPNLDDDSEPADTAQTAPDNVFTANTKKNKTIKKSNLDKRIVVDNITDKETKKGKVDTAKVVDGDIIVTPGVDKVKSDHKSRLTTLEVPDRVRDLFVIGLSMGLFVMVANLVGFRANVFYGLSWEFVFLEIGNNVASVYRTTGNLWPLIFALSTHAVLMPVFYTIIFILVWKLITGAERLILTSLFIGAVAVWMHAFFDFHASLPAIHGYVWFVLFTISGIAGGREVKLPRLATIGILLIGLVLIYASFCQLSNRFKIQILDREVSAMKMLTPDKYTNEDAEKLAIRAEAILQERPNDAELTRLLAQIRESQLEFRMVSILSNYTQDPVQIAERRRRMLTNPDAELYNLRQKMLDAFVTQQQVNRTHPDGYRQLAKIYRNYFPGQDGLENALVNIQLAIKHAPTRSVYYLEQARILLQLERQELAQKAAEKALELSELSTEQQLILTSDEWEEAERIAGKSVADLSAAGP